jgi:hypothetical protein
VSRARRQVHVEYTGSLTLMFILAYSSGYAHNSNSKQARPRLRCTHGTHPPHTAWTTRHQGGSGRECVRSSAEQGASHALHHALDLYYCRRHITESGHPLDTIAPQKKPRGRVCIVVRLPLQIVTRHLIHPFTQTPSQLPCEQQETTNTREC